MSLNLPVKKWLKDFRKAGNQRKRTIVSWIKVVTSLWNKLYVGILPARRIGGS